jgi:hypothetical protein
MNDPVTATESRLHHPPPLNLDLAVLVPPALGTPGCHRGAGGHSCGLSVRSSVEGWLTGPVPTGAIAWTGQLGRPVPASVV